MADTEKELDAALAGAADALETSGRLFAGAAEAGQALAKWKEANGITSELEAKFFAKLSPEDRKRCEEDEETFKRDLQRELDAVTASAPPGAPAKRRAGRSFA